MTNLEKLTKRVQELVPGIMELKFGCEFESKFNNPEKRIMTVVDFDNVKVLAREQNPYLMDNANSQTWFIFKSDINKILGTSSRVIGLPRIFFKSDIKKILGRPITLEDVLVALIKVIDEECENDDRKQEYVQKTLRILSLWTMHQPLYLQSEELINYLVSIICQKK